MTVVEQYGPEARQDVEWFLPDVGDPPFPTVVLIHGGFWRARYNRTLEDDLAADLASRGYLVANLEYRPADAGWPAALVDVAAGVDHLAVSPQADLVDLDRVALVGHSAGGHLALWAASRHVLPPGSPGGEPRGPAPVLAVGQAPVAALAEASRAGLGDGAVDAFVGGPPSECPQRYAAADPLALLPTGVRTVCLHAERDDTVPLRQSERYVTAAVASGDDADLVVVPGGHYEHLDPDSLAAEALRQALRDL